MRPVSDEGGGLAPPSLSIPEIRDYQKINAELVALLDQGHRLVRLEGAEGQRLLASGLSGSWQAVVEIVGQTGPEVAADLDAPDLVIVARGPTARWRRARSAGRPGDHPRRGRRRDRLRAVGRDSRDRRFDRPSGRPRCSPVGRSRSWARPAGWPVTASPAGGCSSRGGGSAPMPAGVDGAAG